MNKLILATVIILSGCTSSESRYSLTQDVAPESIPNLANIENAQPRYERYSLAGNKDYEVLGQQYNVIQNPEVFTQTGIASWYGKKFHGHQTSNAEIYDMFSMTAAHKTLPLPSYLEVENTENGKKIIVRVNDRGPFHSERIVDLSYAAAAKLDILQTGTAKVKITLLKPEKPQNNAEWQTARLNRYFIQLAAISDQKKARQAAIVFSKQLTLPTSIMKSKNVYRVRLGPFYDFDQTQEAELRAREHQINGAFVVVEPIASTRGLN